MQIAESKSSTESELNDAMKVCACHEGRGLDGWLRGFFRHLLLTAGCW